MGFKVGDLVYWHMDLDDDARYGRIVDFKVPGSKWVNTPQALCEVLDLKERPVWKKERPVWKINIIGIRLVTKKHLEESIDDCIEHLKLLLKIQEEMKKR